MAGEQPEPNNGDFTFTNGKVLKQDVFPCLSRESNAYRVYLTSTELILQSIKNEHSIDRFHVQDLFGCHTLRHSKNVNNSAAYLCFYTYPKTKRCRILGGESNRERMPLVFLIQKIDKSFEENLKLAVEWKYEALKIIRSGHIDYCARRKSGIGQEELRTSDISVAVSSFYWFRRRYLVILNPKSGQGKSVSLYRDKVLPILKEAGIDAELLITASAGHAKSFVGTISFQGFHGICSVGGDGLLFEIVNGLRSRADSSEIAEIPVGVIASGSGNGLARSLSAYSGDSNDYLNNPILSSTLAVARGNCRAVNLTEVILDSNKIYSFLSAGWGLLADIDVESEVLRRLGEPRFTIWSLLRLINLKKYKASLTYIPTAATSGNSERSSSEFSPHSCNDEKESVHIDGDFINIYSSIQSYIGSDLKFAPSALANDGLIHLTYILGNAGRACATQFLLGLDKGEHLNTNQVNYVTVREFSIQSKGGIGGNLTVDGERVSAEKMVVRISSKPLYVFTL